MNIYLVLALNILLLILHCSAKFIKRENCHCEDYYGSCRVESEEWVEDGTWNFRCSRNVTTFTGCSASSRGRSRLIKPNKNLFVDGFTFSCSQTEQKLRYEEEARCNVDGIDLHIGETLQEEYFQRKCLETGVWITGCYFSDAGKQIFLDIGSSAKVGRVIHHCSTATDYPGRIQYWTSIDETSTAPTAQQKVCQGILREGMPIVYLLDRWSTSEDILNFLSSPPLPWVTQYADAFIRTDIEPRTKIRFLLASKWT